jgi:hypothetical protein
MHALPGDGVLSSTYIVELSMIRGLTFCDQLPKVCFAYCTP